VKSTLPAARCTRQTASCGKELGPALPKESWRSRPRAHQRGQVAHRAVGAHDHADDVLVRAADRREAVRPDAEVADEVRLHDDRRHGREAEGVAVGRAGGDRAHPDHAGAAVSVRHHHALAEDARHVLAKARA
jgi:hypothetical protein